MKRHIMVFVPLVAALLLMLPQRADAAFSAQDDLSDIWTVAADETQRVWKDRDAEDNLMLSLLVESYKLDVDFSTKTLIEGEKFGEIQREPFTAEFKDGKLYMKMVQTTGSKPKLFIWTDLGDGKALVEIEGNELPPVVMVRRSWQLHVMGERYGIYSGVWRYVDVTPFAQAMLEDGQSMTAKEKEFVQGLRISVDFAKGDLDWHTKEGEQAYTGAMGGFYIKDAEDGFILQFTADSLQWRVKDADNAVVEYHGVAAPITKVK